MGLIRKFFHRAVALFLMFFVGIAAVDTISRIVSTRSYHKINAGMSEDAVIDFLGAPRFVLTAKSTIGRPIAPLLSRLSDDDRMLVYGYSRVKACIVLNRDGVVTAIQTVADE